MKHWLVTKIKIAVKKEKPLFEIYRAMFIFRHWQQFLFIIYYWLAEIKRERRIFMIKQIHFIAENSKQLTTQTLLYIVPT